jgi:hypothetical protein
MSRILGAPEGSWYRRVFGDSEPGDLPSGVIQEFVARLRAR